MWPCTANDNNIFFFQQPANTKDTGHFDGNKTDVHVLDLEYSTDLHQNQLVEKKTQVAVSDRVEIKLLKQISNNLSHIQQRQLSQADNQECRNDWMMVAMVIDRLLLLIFTLLSIVVCLILLLNRPTYDYSHVDQPLDTMGL